MSSPSSARVNASSSRIRSSKRDVGPSASRSRVFGASSVSNSSRVVNGTAAANTSKSSARVYLDGVDVTPQSLLVSRIKPSTAQQSRPVKGKRSKQTGSVAGASVILSQDHFSSASIDESDNDAAPVATTSSSQKAATAQPTAKSKAPGGGTAALVPSAAATPTSTPVAPEDDETAGVDGEAGAETVASKMMVDIGAPPSTVQTAQPTATAAPKPEKRMRRPVTVVLTETPTEMLFELRSLCVAQDASYHQAVATRNRQYVEMCAAKKGSDKFVEGRSQTLQLAQKTKEVMTAPPATRDSACMATDWDIFDCIRVEDESNNDHDDNSAVEATGHDKPKTPGDQAENGEVILKQQVHDIVSATMVSPGCVLDVDGDIVDDLRARQHALRHSRKHRQGHSNSQNNSQKSRVFHHSSGANTHSSQDFGRSMANSSSSMVSPSQSSGNASFGASQDVVGGAGGEDSSNSVANSQIGLSGGASQILSNGSSDGKQGQNAYARANTNVDMGEIIAQQRTAKVLASSSLLKTVSIVERAVQQNVYHHQHVQYRNFPVLTPPAVISESQRKDKLVSSDHQGWRSSIGIGSDSSSNGVTGPAGLVPPISSFPTTAAVGLGAALPGRSAKSALEKLWAFRCSLTEGRTVTCLAWNSVNDDLLAVAYSRAEARPDCPSATGVVGGVITGNTSVAKPEETSSDDGLVLFWSLKNPEFPERIYNLDAGVTSIDFSQSHPYMLAVGFVNGIVAIYDTRKDNTEHQPDTSTGPSRPFSTSRSSDSRPPSAAGGSVPTSVQHRYVPIPDATSETSGGKHLDAVWQVKWISKGSDRGENVVSISSDGRVTEWSLKKGLSYSDLMTLKRVANPLLGSDARGEGGVISRQASGHCIDFATHDPSVYFVGTEDGIIHKCSVSYNEQYLETYLGHTGPVYQIIVSPFSPDLFLSCSADWNVKLWHQADQKEAFNFRSVNLQHAVLGISWCPSDATIFGAVTEDGRIEIWDLQHSTLDPIITHYPKKMCSSSSTRPTSKRTATTANGSFADGAGISAGSSTAMFGSLDDVASHVVESNQSGGAASNQPSEVVVECTKIAFAPSAPVIVVGDSCGDVTVYRVPALTDGTRAIDQTNIEDQVARLLRVLSPIEQES